MAWPTIAAPTYGTDGEVYKPQVRTEFEANYVQSRPRSTRETRRWTLVWNVMSEAHYQLLEAAYIADAGNSFSWTEPVTSTAYTVRYGEDSLRWSHVAPGYRSVSVRLEEV